MSHKIVLTSCSGCPFRGASDFEASTCYHPKRVFAFAEPYDIGYGEVEDSEVNKTPPAKWLSSAIRGNHHRAIKMIFKKKKEVFFLPFTTLVWVAVLIYAFAYYSAPKKKNKK